MLTLADVKKDLRIIHNADDDILKLHMRAARHEVLNFCNREDFTDLDHAHDLDQAQLLLIRAMYDAVEPDKLVQFRSAAEAKMMPYRVCVGV